MNILVTGGAGYIGSHTSVELINQGYNIIIIDNLINSSIDIIKNIKKIVNKDFRFYKFDLRNKNKLKKVFEDNKIDIVLHFASLKSLAESLREPLKYYNYNIVSSLTLFEVMDYFNVRKLIFSSSAAVYGASKSLPIKENSKLKAKTPYGITKIIIENMLKDIYISNNNWSIICLRYFNPVGAHSSGLIGESLKIDSNNLANCITQVVTGKLNYLNIFGNDYNTIDGTGVRDYVHVVDLALGNIKAIEKIKHQSGMFIYNLGRGQGYSVLEFIRAFEQVVGFKINYKILKKRSGDIAQCWADTEKARKELGWTAKKNINDICKDLWHFIDNKKN